MFAWVGRSFLSLPVHDRKFQHHLMKKLFGMEKRSERERERERERIIVERQQRKTEKGRFVVPLLEETFLCENSSRVINLAVVHG
jgi:hypothetical protein